MSYDPAKKQAQTAENGGNPQSLPSLADAFDISDAQTEAFMNGGWELSPLGQTALHYARHEIAVFPCVPAEPPDPDPKRRKRPSSPGEGFKDATANPEAVCAWWTEHPNDNPAFEPGRHGLHVIDVDPAKGGFETWKALQEAHGAAPATHVVDTPNDGQHFYFTLPAGCEGLPSNSLGDGVDTRGVGGYVLLPASRIKRKDNTGFAEYQVNPFSAGTPIAPLPLWIKEQLTRAAGADGGNFDWEQRRHPDRPMRPVKNETIQSRLYDITGDRSAVAFGTITLLRNQNYSPEEIYSTLDGLSHLHVMDHYAEHASGFEDALRADIRRAFAKDKGPPQAVPPEIIRAVNEQAPETGWPAPRDIPLVENYLPNAVKAIDQALVEQKMALFERDGQIVRAAEGLIETRNQGEVAGDEIRHVGVAELRVHMSGAARFQRWTEQCGFRTVNAPEDVARAYYEMRGGRSLRPLYGIINAPTLRPDGSLLDQPGYDEATGLLYDPHGVAFPQIVEKPTKEQAQAALGVIKELLRTFPFEGGAEHSTALSAALSTILTALVRRSLPLAPLHAFSATTRGAGKGKLSDIASVLPTGHEASSFTQGRDEAETDKRVVAKLRRGHAVVLIDNCSLPLGGDTLESLLTRETYSSRILGTSGETDIINNALLLASGNNLEFTTDMVRRVVRCHLVVDTEFPERLRFDNEPVSDARRDRPALVAAGLTILRGYIAAGRPDVGLTDLGSFEEWSRLVRNSLMWLGEADPVGPAIEMDDPLTQQLRTLLVQIHKVMGLTKFRGKELIERAQNSAIGENAEARQQLLQALTAVAGDRRPGYPSLNPMTLGRYLARNKGRVVGGLRVLAAGIVEGYQMWQMQQIADLVQQG